MALRCLILENQLMVGQMLRTLLQPLRELEIAGLARSCREGLAICRQVRPDLLIVDPDLPDGDGTAVARAALEGNPRIRLVVLCSAARSFRCPPDLEACSITVIDRSSPFHVLLTALADLLGPIQPPSAPSPRASCDPLSLLTPRQGEIFLLIGRGLQSKTIARSLGLTLHTVASHRKEISRRLALSGAELVHLAALQVAATAESRPHLPAWGAPPRPFGEPLQPAGLRP